MKKLILFSLVLLIVFQVSALDVSVPSSSRSGVSIPAYLTLPADYDDTLSYPFVIMLHGHGGNHNEFGGYDPISDGLAENGYVVATLDFSGCGASTESFKLNTMTNMKSDIKDVVSYVSDNYNIDSERIGAFGYSMGGRLILELISEGYDVFSAVELVAPAEDLEDLKGLFGGHDNWEVLRAEAEENGYVDYTTIYATLPLSIEWFNDLEANYDGLVEKAAPAFDIPVMVMWSLNDETVSPSVSENVADVLGALAVRLPFGGHQYGFYNTDPFVQNTTFHSSIGWFMDNL